MSTLFIPLSLAALGIVLRGLGLRLPEAGAEGRRPACLGYLFAVSSVLTPFFMGTVVGGIASGRVPVGNATGDPVTSWLNPVSLLVGVLFVATGAYLSAVFLISDARRFGDFALERYFAVRALAAALVAGVVALAGVFVLRDDARYVYDRLTDQALPLMILSAVCGLGVIVLLRRGAPRGARVLAVGAVVGVVWGWGVAQFPYLLPKISRSPKAPLRTRPSPRCWWCSGRRSCSCCRHSALLYMLSQRSILLEGEAEGPGR